MMAVHGDVDSADGTDDNEDVPPPAVDVGTVMTAAREDILFKLFMLV
jgi:hypothetical protein